MSVINELSKPLSIDDIEFRIGSVAKVYNKGDKPKGFSMLAYKTARTDVKRLNEAVGLNWKNRYFYDDNKILCCEISVYNPEIKEWVSRIDVGTESMTEKEKGSYSDAFKRAGFKWGIGTELYNMPFIWINWNDWSELNGKFTPKSFDNKMIKIDEYIVENAEVKKLKLSHKGTVIYEFGKNIKPKEDIKPPVKEIKYITDEQFDILADLIMETEADEAKFLDLFKVEQLDKMPFEYFTQAEKALLNKKAKMEKEKK